MRNTKVKNLKTTHICKDNYEKKIPKFHPANRSRSLCKSNSRNGCFAKSTGAILRFHFLNPNFKNTRIRCVL